MARMMANHDFVVFGDPVDTESPERDANASSSSVPGRSTVDPFSGLHQGRSAFGGHGFDRAGTSLQEEAWAPKAFSSSRQRRAASSQQRAEDFMAEDELEEYGKRNLETTAMYDSFGNATARQAQAAAMSTLESRPGLPKSLPKELFEPVPESVGIRLLQRMGWRQGKGVGTQASSRPNSKSKWGPMSNVLPEAVGVHVAADKTDSHGLGFDPFSGAEEFRQAKRQRSEQAGPSRGQEAPDKRAASRMAFGASSRDVDQYDSDDEPGIRGLGGFGDLNATVVSDDEEAGPPPSRNGREGGASLLRLGDGTREPTLRIRSSSSKRGLLPGFTSATQAENRPLFRPPKVPSNFDPVHRFDDASAPSGGAVGTEPPMPSGDVLAAIRGLSALVARRGPAYEALATRTNAKAPSYRFLYGGEGADYYRWHVRKLKAAARDASGLAIGQRSAPLSFEERGALLGEEARPAGPDSSAAAAQQPRGVDISNIAANDRQSLLQTLQSTFQRAEKQDMQPGGGPGGVGAFGLTKGASALPGPPERGATKSPAAMPTSAAPDAGPKFVAFTSATNEAPMADVPRRHVEEWRPSALLCRRFNVPDPYAGRAKPVQPAAGYRVDMLQLESTLARPASGNESGPAAVLPGPPPIPAGSGVTTAAGAQPAAQVEALPLPPPPPLASADAFLSSVLQQPGLDVRPLEAAGAGPVGAPIDLFKTIFEDDASDDSN